MILHWIDSKSVLSKSRADQSSPQQRKLWADQIGGALEMLHDQDIIWGDAKADNILIDAQENAWMVDFGGSYTVGWVDEDKAGTVEGDMQGLAKIMDLLSATDTSS
jgi:serine/threonine protein kinase